MNKRSVLFLWLPWAFALTIIFGCIYVSSQTLLRSLANDPQIELAENTAQKLSNGATPESLLPSQDIVDLRTSISPFIIIYDNAGKILNTDARLDNKLPDVPLGVLEYTRNHVDNRITWQPADGVRNAIVAKHFAGAASGFVVAGRSLRETENHETPLLLVSFLGWAVSLTGTMILIALRDWNHASSPKKTKK